MDSNKGTSEGGDPEDLPSDFFDDFTKDEFMQGLSVIDSWDDDDTGKRRIDAEAVDSVRDLRELIRSDGKDEDRYKKGRSDDDLLVDSKYKYQKESEGEQRRSGSRNKLDDFIKPGSRRDPNKTNEAIKKDKEVKVKEILAKHLDDDLRPPGTELDDYYSDGKPPERRRTPVVVEERHVTHRPREYHRPSRESPPRYRRSPYFNPRSPRREFVPYRNFKRFSPQRKFRRYSPHRRSPHRHSPHRHSPHRHSPRRLSPRRASPPRRSPRHKRRSRSPYHHSPRHSPSTKSYRRDTFLYPNEPTGYPSANAYSEGPYPGPTDYPGGPPGYSYPQGQSYAGGYGPPGYEYAVQPPIAPTIPLPVPAPVQDVTPMPIAPPPALAPAINPPLAMTPAPPMVPPPSQVLTTSPNTANPESSYQPYDALAQLVADGKLSQQDYLKLAPSKGVSNSLDTKTRVAVLNRCNQALSKLTKLLLPNRLLMHHSLIGQEPKCLTPKFVSPLKRQAAVEFEFTKSSRATVQQNKQLVDSIIAAIGLDNVVSRPKKKVVKDMKDAAVQTTKPYCDVCEIRESTRTYDAGTSIDAEHFCSSIHTQVVEHDLVNSKSLFNPTGSATDSAPMSIAHMTPAQLVSQLAARAKTLKQTSDPAASASNQWRNTPNYGNRGGHYNNYDHYNNYRY